MQHDIDEANMKFWDELCGSTLAQTLGIKDNSRESLALFDNWYLDYYDYLLDMVDYADLKNKKVLEIGLGYGTLGQKIAEVASEYTGMDIAAGPVRMMNHRMEINSLSGKAIQGSILNGPFPDAHFDAVVSIGCFHHTGNVARCIEETYRILKPNGVAHLMVYNQYSLRQWARWPLRTFGALLRDCGLRNSDDKALMQQRAAYDTNIEGMAAPETVFCSNRQLRQLLFAFDKVSFRKTNFDDFYFCGFNCRKTVISVLGPILGLDIYLSATK